MIKRFETFLITINLFSLMSRLLPKYGEVWRRGVVVITTVQLNSTKFELKFCAGSNPARGVSDIRDGEDL